jgi:hypothetical protein
LHLVAPPQELPYAMIDVIIDCPIRRRPGPVAEVRRPASQNLIQPLPHFRPGFRSARRVGIHTFTFEACSSFTRVTACQVAHPPSVGFIARLRPCRFPGSGARKLSSPTNNYWSGSFPHWRSAPSRRTEKFSLRFPRAAGELTGTHAIWFLEEDPRSFPSTPQ